MTGGVLILPSPLLPGDAYRGLAIALQSRVSEVAIADATLQQGQGAADLITRWAIQASSGSWLLAHSNAGYLAPAVRAVGSRGPIVFMDAALPPARGQTALAPAAFHSFLAAKIDESGLLPPWTRWWARTDLTDIVPEEMFDDLDNDCPRLPATYFEDSLDPPPGWVGEPNAYLSFGGTYADELAFARQHRWPVHHLDGGHLHFLHAPDLVATMVAQLFSALQRA